MAGQGRQGAVLNAPPPDAVILAVTGLQGPADAAAVDAALRRCDPSARLWTDWARGLVAVQSAAPAKALCAAVQGAGFGVLVQGGPGAPRRGSIGKAIVLALVFGALGLVGGLVLGWIVGLGFYAANPECARPGSCTLMAPVFSALGGLIGLPGGAVAGIVIGLARR